MMGKSKSKSKSNDGAGKRTAAELFAAMLDKGRAWYDREREGIALIEGFQSALLAVRDVGGESEEALSGLAGNADMDPWLAEDLFQQVQELSGTFEELLEEMYTLQTRARGIVLVGAEQQVEATELRPVDYLQMMSQELATFEAEFQHIEALLHLISFETTTDELRTLVISWSTSPFLDPAQTRTFQQRHQLSQRLHT